MLPAAYVVAQGVCTSRNLQLVLSVKALVERFVVGSCILLPKHEKQASIWRSLLLALATTTTVGRFSENELASQKLLSPATVFALCATTMQVATLIGRRGVALQAPGLHRQAAARCVAARAKRARKVTEEALGLATDEPAQTAGNGATDGATETAKPKRRATRATAVPEDAGAEASAAPVRRSRKKAATEVAPAPADDSDMPAGDPEPAPAEPAKPKRTSRRKATEMAQEAVAAEPASDESGQAVDEPVAPAKPKRASRKKTATTVAAGEEAPAEAAAEDAEAKPKAKRASKKAAAAAEAAAAPAAAPDVASTRSRRANDGDEELPAAAPAAAAGPEGLGDIMASVAPRTAATAAAKRRSRSRATAVSGSVEEAEALTNMVTVRDVAG